MIASALNDIIIDGATTIRIEAYDPDGDTVTLSATSSCSALQVGMGTNLLTLTPDRTNTYCQVTVRARSGDGSSVRAFNVLNLDETIYLGSGYDIGGQFADQNETDEYQAYLAGEVTISGTRGYSNQAFYIWVKDPVGNLVITASDTTISGNLTPGLYTIAASLRNPFTGSYYYYNQGYKSGYILSVVDSDLAYTVDDLAADMGIRLSVTKHIPAIQILLLNQP